MNPVPEEQLIVNVQQLDKAIEMPPAQKRQKVKADRALISDFYHAGSDVKKRD